jgi:RimJ/RimL family protein N-acetyltransferase
MTAGLPDTPLLETRRLTLRPLSRQDVPAIQRRFPKWEVVRRYLAVHVPWPYPSDGAATHVAECLEQMARREKCYWAICLKHDPGELIGRIDLWPDDGKSRDQRGFWLDPEFQGQGLMTEAAKRITEFAFVELGWPHLWLSNAEANVASGRIKEKQGAQLIDRTPSRFVCGEVTRMVWLLRREDWLARRSAA